MTTKWTFVWPLNSNGPTQIGLCPINVEKKTPREQILQGLHGFGAPRRGAGGWSGVCGLGDAGGGGVAANFDVALAGLVGRGGTAIWGLGLLLARSGIHQLLEATPACESTCQLLLIIFLGGL